MPKPNMEVTEVLISEGRIVKLQGDLRDCFTVISAIKEKGFKPQVRTLDADTQNWGSWQPC